MTRLKINRPQPFVFKDKTAEAIYQGQNRYPIGQEIIAYESKMENRFILTFPVHFNLQSWAVRAVTKPSLSINLDYEDNHFNGQRYTWNDMVVELYDPIGPSTTRALMDMIHTDIVYNSSEFILEALDRTGVVVERWIITGIITQIDFGEFNVSSDGINTVQIIIKPNHCLLSF